MSQSKPPEYDHRDDPVWTSNGFEAPIRPHELARTVPARPDPPARAEPGYVRRGRRWGHMKVAVADPAQIETK